MQRAGPVMEQVIEENEQQTFINNRDQAQKRNAVELKQTLKFPQELLTLFSHNSKPATVEKVSCVHMFESSPQSKCAVAYVLKRASDDGGEMVYIVVVFSVITNSPIRIVRSESEITQICTPGDDSILIVGTVHGSL